MTRLDTGRIARCFAGALGFALFAPLSSPAQLRDSVWVNERSGVYHCPGTEFYGKTSRGEYLSEGEAQRRGHRANGGRRCHAAVVPVQGLVGAEANVRADEPRAPLASTEECRLATITDGDTLVCEPGRRIRLIGIDTPEDTEEPFYTSASAALASWLPAGAVLRLERDKSQKDRFNRDLAYVWHEGRMVNWLMVRHGWAVSGRYPPDTAHARALDAAETVARRESRGLWRLDAGAKCFRPDRQPGKLC